LRDLLALPDDVTALAAFIEIDARDAADPGPSKHHGREDVVPGVVLDDDRAADADEAVVRGAGTVAEERLRADEPLTVGHGAPTSVDEHVQPRLGIVRDRDPLVAQEGRR